MKNLMGQELTPVTPNTPNNGPDQPNDPQAQCKQARRELLTGIIICVLGLAISFGSYYFASAGGRYTITTGAILWGLYSALKGIFTLGRIKHQAGDTIGILRLGGLTHCGMGLFGFLLYLSFNRVQSQDEDNFLETEQLGSFPGMGIKLRIPAGFTEIESELQEETDSTYGFERFSTYSDGLCLMAEAKIGALSPDSIYTSQSFSDYYQSSNLDFFTDGVLEANRVVSIQGRDMTRCAGKRKDVEGLTYTIFHFVNHRTMITLYFWYEDNRHGTKKIDKQIAEILDNLEFED